MSCKKIYDKLDENELKELYSLNKLQEITNKKYEELSQKELFTSFKDVVLKDIKYYYMLSQKEQEEFVNTHILNIFMDIAYNNLCQRQKLFNEVI